MLLEMGMAEPVALHHEQTRATFSQTPDP
jgi:hypothetical protein